MMMASVPAAAQQGPDIVAVGQLPGASAGLAAYTLAEYEQRRDEFGCSFTSRPRGVGVRPVDGGPERVLSEASDGVLEGSPAWSPDGTALAFTGDLLTAESSTVELVSPVVAQPVAVANGRDGRFAPEGRRLAFVRQREPRAGLVVVGLQESATAGVPLPVVDVDRALAETSTPPAEPGAPLVSIPLDGFVSAPAWSPDGTRLAFLLGSRDGPRRGDLWAVGSDGSGLEQLTSGLDVSASFQSPEWSPDGRHIAFNVDETGAAGGFGVVLHVFDLEDGSTRRIEDGGAPGWSWHPAGDRLALGGSGEVEIVTPEGGLLGVMRHGMDAMFGAPAWTADGRRLLLLLRNYNVSCDLPRLWAFDVETSSGARLSEEATTFPGSARIASPGLTDRVAGLDRILTAVELSRQTFESATAVVLARADVYADALVAGPLAGALGAPLLLTGSDALHPAVGEEIVRLGASEVVLVGGEEALSPQVQSDLERLGVTIRRVEGEDRFALAAVVAEELDANAAYLVEGANPDPTRGWPDAVSVSALAAAQGRPVLLTNAGELPEATDVALRALEKVVIVGGTVAVSQDVEDEVAALVDEVDRIAGANRYETSARVAARGVDAGLDEDGTLLVTGLNWPDSLAAGPAAAASGVGVLLLDGQRLEASPPAISWLQEREDPDGRLRLVGGLEAVRQTVAVDVERAATDR